MKVKTIALMITISSMSINTFAGTNQSPLPSGINNGAFIYDQSYQGSTKVLTLGSMSNELVPFIESNIKAFPKNKSLLYTYGTDLELSCGNSDPSSCILNMYYSNSSKPYFGKANTETYNSKLNQYKNNIEFAPIVGGGFWSGGLLVPMEKMTQPQLNKIADEVAKSLCSDDNVSGISFDLEPYNAKTAPTQNMFYSQIAKDLAGKNPTVTNCVNKQYHPQGRYFSIFISPNQSASSVASMAKYLNQYHNGYAILSFYNLGNSNVGKKLYPFELSQYTNNFQSDLNKWQASNKGNNVKYQIAIPAGADNNEFAYCQNLPFSSSDTCGSPVSNVPSNAGSIQNQYVSAAINTMIQSNVNDDSNFMGVTLWAFQPEMVWKGISFYPSSVTAESYEAINKAGL